MHYVQYRCRKNNGLFLTKPDILEMYIIAPIAALVWFTGTIWILNPEVIEYNIEVFKSWYNRL